MCPDSTRFPYRGGRSGFPVISVEYEEIHIGENRKIQFRVHGFGARAAKGIFQDNIERSKDIDISIYREPKTLFQD
jgi:hypothetical protein